MKTVKTLIVFLVLCAISSAGFCNENDSSLPRGVETRFLKKLNKWEFDKTDQNDALSGLQWQLRSRHFIFGMPRLLDDRYNFKPDGFAEEQPGITMLVREGFVIAHFDLMKSPLWVAQRWTKYDYTRMKQVPSQKKRPWRDDLELPQYARGGTVYDHGISNLDRGHMARHETNRGWGVDSSNWGCKMSNSAPQHTQINQHGTWRTLEDKIRDVVNDEESGIEAIWTFSGTIYRDKTNPEGETPEDDYQSVVRLPSGGFGVPDATYKIVCWFDEGHDFQGRAYVFEQPHEVGIDGKLEFELGETKAPLTTYLIKIDDLEKRTGIDFFPMLRDNIENLIEETQYDNLWGE